MDLCSLCLSITLSKMRGPNLDRMQPHQPSYLALKKSADTGCQLCSFLWMSLEQGTGIRKREGRNRLAMSHVSERYPGRQISLVAWGGQGRNLDRIHIITAGDIPDVEDEDEDAPADPTMHPDHQIALDGVVDLYAYPEDPAAWHGGVTGRPLPRTAGDAEEDFELVRKWLRGCSEQHVTCSKADLNTLLPTRIIDIGPSDGSVEPYLLHADRKKGLYVTLSHCWGGKVPLTTTTATLEERKRSIPLASLPKTFREAVIITRRLGLRYLWIDSLCILQDSPEDWEKESAVMGDVYASSLLTVAARGADNAVGGCFIPREEEPPPCRLQYNCPEHSVSGSMYIRSPAFQIERLRDTPLDTRGWVLQERLLSPRILHFGRQQLYWECAETTIRQDGKAADVTTDDLRVGTDFKADLDFNAPISFIGDGTFARVYQPSDRAHFDKVARFLQWYNTVTEYTRRDLTRQSDKLPAISGIAKTFQAKTGCTYLAGLWKEDLLAGTLWYLARPSNESISTLLPSWSWARLKGVVHFWSQRRGLPLRVLDDTCALVHVSYTFAGGLNPYGDIADAKLQIRGRLIEVNYKPPIPTGNEFQTTIYSTSDRPIGQVRFDSQASRPDQNRTFRCVLVHGDDTCAAALALESANANRTSYKRIGYVHVEASMSGEDGRTPFSQSLPQVITII